MAEISAIGAGYRSDEREDTKCIPFNPDSAWTKVAAAAEVVQLAAQVLRHLGALHIREAALEQISKRRPPPIIHRAEPHRAFDRDEDHRLRDLAHLVVFAKMAEHVDEHSRIVAVQLRE